MDRMLDHRYETFLALCHIKNYTKTAALLNMTQPGVTQHIQYYRDRTLTLTARGQKLLAFVSRLKADSLHAMDMLSDEQTQPPIRFGATLTIGEYMMPPIIQRIYEASLDVSLSMQVGNTTTLLEQLRRGKIQFALLEGFFDRSAYDSMCLKTENFVAVCAPESPLAKGPVTLEQLLEHKLILREQGSGTREVLEHALARYNLTIRSFKGITEIGNMNAIKHLVAGNLGISFMYEVAVAREIEHNILCQINIADFVAAHDFSFVTLKNSIHQEEYSAWFERLKQLGFASC